jgi:hypothetical protein
VGIRRPDSYALSFQVSAFRLLSLGRSWSFMVHTLSVSKIRKWRFNCRHAWQRELAHDQTDFNPGQFPGRPGTPPWLSAVLGTRLPLMVENQARDMFD